MGNPGGEYDRTRHNLGAETVALLAGRHGSRLRKAKERALTAEVNVEGRRLALAWPQTYVNDSGLAVRPLVRRHVDGDATRLVVVHDELDLPVGRVRVKVGGGTAGHNGLKSIEAHLHTRDFLRVRIGIGKPPGRREGTDHVLRRPSKTDREALDVAVEVAADAVERILADGAEAAMRIVNARHD